MTAQVFRNGQQPTFYVSDAIAPGPAGLNGTFATLTATKELIIFVNPATGVFPPLQILSVGAPNAAIGAQFLDGSTGGAGSVGINTVEANPTLFIAADAGMGVKIITGGAERIRIFPGGMVADFLATNVLAQVPGIPTLFFRPMVSGSYTPVWTSDSGFSLVGTVSGVYSQNGNVVTVSIQVTTATTAVGINVASVTLPILPPADFVAGTEVIGVLTMNTDAAASATAGFISARPATKLANVAVSAQAITLAPVTMSFQYLLS